MSNINPYLVQYLQRSEGYRAATYDDVGHRSVGYGHLITGPDDFRNMDLDSDGKLSKGEANKQLLKDIEKHQVFMKDLTVDITEGQKAAITSLAYNIGAEHKGVKGIVSLLNQGKTEEAGEKFLQYNKARRKGTKEYKTLPALAKRRTEEQAVFTGRISLKEFGQHKGKMKTIKARMPKGKKNASEKTYLSELDGMKGKWGRMTLQVGGASESIPGNAEFFNRLRTEGSGT